MSERSYSRLARKHELEDEQRIARACALLESEPSLRFLLWRVFESLGMASSPFSQDPLTMAHRAGMITAGELILALLEPHAPDLYPELMKEQKNAQRSRDADLRAHLADTDPAD